MDLTDQTFWRFKVPSQRPRRARERMRASFRQRTDVKLRNDGFFSFPSCFCFHCCCQNSTAPPGESLVIGGGWAAFFFCPSCRGDVIEWAANGCTQIVSSCCCCLQLPTAAVEWTDRVDIYILIGAEKRGMEKKRKQKPKQNPCVRGVQ